MRKFKQKYGLTEKNDHKIRRFSTKEYVLKKWKTWKASFFEEDLD